MGNARRRSKSVRRQRRVAKATSEDNFRKAPHSFVFCRPGVGTLVKSLSIDLRKIFEPFTATNLKVSRKNVLKDFINVAGPLNVSHLMYLTRSDPEKSKQKFQRYAENLKNRNSKKAEQLAQPFSNSEADGNVYLHLIRSPHGPSLTFRVEEYCLTKDVTNVVRRVFSTTQFMHPPLLAMTGFSSNQEELSSALRLTVDMFQNMLPPLNVQNLKLSNVKRVLLLSRDFDPAANEDIIHIRHYHIRVENRNLSKPLRRLGLGGSKLKKRVNATGGLGPSGRGKGTNVPNLARFVSIEDFVTKQGLLTDSGMSDLDEEQRDVEITAAGAIDAPENATKRSQLPTIQQGFKHLTSSKASIRLVEIGPRLSLQLIKIEEGVNDGNVLYHKYHHKTDAEKAQKADEIRERERTRQLRAEEQEQRRLQNLQAKEREAEAHKSSCLKGMALQKNEDENESEEMSTDE